MVGKEWLKTFLFQKVHAITDPYDAEVKQIGEIEDGYTGELAQPKVVNG